MVARVTAWLAVGTWAAVIYAFSSIPGSKIPGGYSIEGHLGEYALLGALIFIALRLDLGARRALVLSIAIASAYGATDEIHQFFTPLRTPDVVDWAVDTLGATIGAACAYWALRVAARRIGEP